MNEVINVYCDESCHLEHDDQTAMVLGAIWCPQDLTKSISKELIPGSEHFWVWWWHFNKRNI